MLCDEAGPFHAAVEIVDHQEAAAQQVVAQPRGFLVAEHPAADFDRVDPRVVEQLLVHDRQRLAFVRGIDPRQALTPLIRCCSASGQSVSQPPRLPERAPTLE